MTHLDDLFDPELFQLMRKQRYVNVKDHPSEPLRVMSYSANTQWDREWNDVTRTCRGLIVNTDTGKVVARPFGKFFNYGETDAPTDLSGPVHVTDKLDGSLGVLYQAPSGQYAIATKLSFTSPQARHASAVYQDRYDGAWSPNPSWTYLFEIVYPTNRIVVDYGTTDDLFLLAAIDTATGRTVPFQDAVAGWPGPIVEQFPYPSITDALAAAVRDGREGLVVHALATDTRVKIKYAEYKRLHRIMTDLSARHLWEHMAVAACKDLVADPRHWGSYLGMDPARAQECLGIGDAWLSRLCEGVPDELYTWMKSTMATIQDTVDTVTRDAYAVADRVRAECGDDPRAMFAALRDEPLQKELMRLLLHGQAAFVVMKAWRQAEPDHVLPFAGRGQPD